MVTSGANASAGEIIAGRYRIEGWVGQGNMAMVFRATHLGTGRVCALKLVHAHLVERPKIQEMFIQEARVGGRIGKNPYIVDVFDAGIDSDRGVPFLAMDLLEGTTLDKYIKEYGQMPPGLLKTLWQQLAEALEQAHAAGVVHRDLKPGNLFLTYDRKGNPQLRVVDFGIAKLMEEGVQRTATQIGTPAYAAPEQLGNGMRTMAERMGYKVASSISPATDIWALGVVTYELLIGAPPGQLWTGLERGAATDLLVLVATGPVPSGTARAGAKGILLPPGFDAWLERCLQKHAADRWPSVELAVQNLISLFDSASNRLGTLKLPPIAAIATVQPKTANSTVIIGSPPKRNSDAADIVSTPNELKKSGFPGYKMEPSSISSSGFLESASAGTSGLTETNSSLYPAQRVDGTSIGVTETLTPARAIRTRRVGLAILAGLGVLSLLIIVLGTVFSKKAEVVASPPSDPLSASNAPISAPLHVEPIPTVTVAGNEKSIDSNRIPVLVSAAPTASLWGRLPSPKSSRSAASLEASTAPSPSVPPAAQPAEGNAFLNINSIPVSKIILDGKPIGSTPKVGVSVPAGSHTVVFIHPEKGKKSIAVTVKPGETKAAAVKFDP